MDESGGSTGIVDQAEQLARVESALSYLLRGGVILSTLIVVAGVVMMFVHHPDYFTRALPAQTVAREMAFPHTVAEVFGGLKRGEGRSIIIVGLFVLIATPVLRVAMSVLVFFHQRDRMFTVITLIVLVLLLISFLVGRAGG